MNATQSSQKAVSRLQATFSRIAPRAALVPYLTAGEPSIKACPKLMHALVGAGADIIELGVPFSDPMADGPVIQRASQRAIERGVGLRQVFDMVKVFRQDDATTPVVLMGYANSVERLGQQQFIQLARQAGIDGLLVVDYPPEEISDFAQSLSEAGIAPIFLLAPTSSTARIKQVAQVARGYVYYVSLKGVTGAATLNVNDVKNKLQAIRQYVDIPVGVGFGIRDEQGAKQIAQFADAVVIGSKLIETLETAYQKACSEGATNSAADQAAIDAASDWLSRIRAALN